MSDVLATELVTLERERARLEKEHLGKFVLIHKDEVIGTYDDFAAAANEGLRQFGEAPFLIRQIGQNTADVSAAVVYGLTSVGSIDSISGS